MVGEMKLKHNDSLAVIPARIETDLKALRKEIARDIALEVAHHIRIMYPDAVKAASSTFLLSVKGCVTNEVMGALAVDQAGPAIERLKRRAIHRREIQNAYRKIRKEP